MCSCRVSGWLLLRRGQHQCQLHRHGGRAGERWHLYQFCSMSIRILLSAWHNALQHHRCSGSELLHCTFNIPRCMHSACSATCSTCSSATGACVGCVPGYFYTAGSKSCTGACSLALRILGPSGGLIDAGRQLATPTPTSRRTPAPPPRALVLACGTALLVDWRQRARRGLPRVDRLLELAEHCLLLCGCA